MHKQRCMLIGRWRVKKQKDGGGGRTRLSVAKVWALLLNSSSFLSLNLDQLGRCSVPFRVCHGYVHLGLSLSLSNCIGTTTAACAMNAESACHAGHNGNRMPLTSIHASSHETVAYLPRPTSTMSSILTSAPRPSLLWGHSYLATA